MTVLNLIAWNSPSSVNLVVMNINPPKVGEIRTYKLLKTLKSFDYNVMNYLK